MLICNWYCILLLQIAFISSAPLYCYLCEYCGEIKSIHASDNPSTRPETSERSKVIHGRYMYFDWNHFSPGRQMRGHSNNVRARSSEFLYPTFWRSDIRLERPV